MKNKKEVTCNHCEKSCDETKCVKEGDKKFCCSDCQKDHKKKDSKIKKSPNICKFC